MPAELSLDHVWITPQGNAVLLDGSWPDVVTAAKCIPVGDIAGQQRFLNTIAACVESTSIPLHAKSVLNNNQYGIRQRNLVSYRRRDDPELPVYPHSQRELIRLLGNFLINTSRLMVDGRLEFVLRYRDVLREEDKRPSVFGF